MRRFENGPLPDEFKDAALEIDSVGEFGLAPEQAKAYCRWAEECKLEVIGFEMWLSTGPGPSVVTGAVFDGNANDCAVAMDEYLQKLGDLQSKGPVYFVVYTRP